MKKRLENGVNAIQHRNYESELVKLLRSNLSPKQKKKELVSYHENDIAAALEALTSEERLKIYVLLDTDMLVGVLEYAEDLGKILSELTPKKRHLVLSRLDNTVLSEYLEDLEEEEKETLIKMMDEEARQDVLLLDSFEDDEIGSKMSTNFVAIKNDCTVRQAMKEVVRQAADNDNITTIYVVDNDETFAGAIDLKDLIIARETTDLSTITITSYPHAYGFELVADCIERIKDYSEDSIPILDAQNRIQGVLLSQDLTDLVEEEISEDYAKLAGLTEEEDLREPVKKSVAKRLPWLAILLGLGLIVSAVVGAFEGIVAHIAIIVSFQSLILGMAGNVGTQSLAVTVRVLSKEELTSKEKASLVGKEVRIGFINGLILGALSFLLVTGYLMLFKSESLSMALSISACTAIALLFAMVLSSLTGTVIPILFKKLKIDPAVASGPFITTINDLVAVVSYYGLAWILLISILGI